MIRLLQLGLDEVGRMIWRGRKIGLDIGSMMLGMVMGGVERGTGLGRCNV